MRSLRITLIVIGAFQLVLGGLFTLLPIQAAAFLGLEPVAPPWANWLLVMMGARFLGFAYGMALAARDPFRHVTWINAMIGIQAIDWLATLVHLVDGSMRLQQVGTASFMPVLFVVALLWLHPRRFLRAHTTGPAD